MTNMVGVQTVLSALVKSDSHAIRQALQKMDVDIDYKDEVDMDALDMKKLDAEVKKINADLPK